MAGKFNLAALMAEGKVSELDTKGREQIEYIHIDRIDDDPNNFYELSGLKELAENIELIGLQQPLRVRTNPEDSSRVILVSGHRRRAAIRVLVEDGREDLAEIPCIREQAESSAALQELRLIYANSDTRKMTSADLSKQAERVEALLYQLKEEGYDFPGRMRDHVAEACKVSKSKLARLKVIRENLGAEWRPYYEDGSLAESTAYTLAQMPGAHQSCIFEGIKKKNQQVRHLYQQTAENYGKKLADVDELVCKRGARKDFPCSNIEGKRNQVVSQSGWYGSSSCSKCCDKCEQMAKCKNACPMLADKVTKLKASAKAQRAHEKQVQEEKDRPVISEIMRYWNRFGEARNAADKTVRECYKALNMYYSSSDDSKVVALECLEAKFTTNTNLPYGYSNQLSDVKRYVKIADLLGVSLDYLLCRTDNPHGFVSAEPPAEGWLPLQWLPGEEKPQKPTLAAAQFDLGKEQAYTTIVQWDGDGWCFKNNGAHLELKCLRWFPLPKEETT